MEQKAGWSRLQVSVLLLAAAGLLSSLLCLSGHQASCLYNNDYNTTLIGLPGTQQTRHKEH